MQTLCVVLTVVRIIVDEKNSSGVRHDNHAFPGKWCVDRAFRRDP
jgi:hypothetical protein